MDPTDLIEVPCEIDQREFAEDQEAYLERSRKIKGPLSNEIEKLEKEYERFKAEDTTEKSLSKELKEYQEKLKV